MRYFVYKDSDIAGPYDAEELARLGADPDTLVYAESVGGGKAWRPLSEILGLPADAEGPAALPPIPEKNLDEMIADFDLDAELWPGAGGEADAAPPLDVFLDLIEISPELGLPKTDAAEPRRPEAPVAPEPETAGETALLAEIARLRERLAALEKAESDKATPEKGVSPSNPAASEEVPTRYETPAAGSLDPVVPEPPAAASQAEPSFEAETEIVFEAPKTFPVLDPDPAAEIVPAELESSAAAIEPIAAPEPAEASSGLQAAEETSGLNPAEPETRKSGAFEEELRKVLGPASGISAFTSAPAAGSKAVPESQPPSADLQVPASGLFAATPGAGLSAVPSASEFTTGIFGTTPSFQAPAPEPFGSAADLAPKPSMPKLETAPTQPFAAVAAAPAAATQDLISELAPSGPAAAPSAKGKKSAAKPKKKGGKAAYFILGGLVLIAGGAGYFLLNGGLSPAKPAPESAPATGLASAPPPVLVQQAAQPQQQGQPFQAASSGQGASAQGQAQAPATPPISPEAQAAIDLVKNYPLDGNRGTVAQWLQYSFTANPGDDNREEWTAGALSGSSYEVQYRVVPGPQSSLPQSISYLFVADAQSQTVQGANAAAKQLLAGGQTPSPATPAQQAAQVTPQQAQPAPQN